MTAACGGSNTSGPKVMWGGFKPRQSAKARSLGYAEEQAPTISTDENYAVCGAIGLDHVLLSGGTTFQGRGWYDEVSGCLKTMPHGVMTDKTERG